MIKSAFYILVTGFLAFGLTFPSQAAKRKAEGDCRDDLRTFTLERVFPYFRLLDEEADGTHAFSYVDANKLYEQSTPPEEIAKRFVTVRVLDFDSPEDDQRIEFPYDQNTLSRFRTLSRTVG